jgi:hypothetical protein
MSIRSVVRTALISVSIATAAMATWLASVVLFVLPARDPDHVLLWGFVAVGSGGLVALSVLTTRRTTAGTVTPLVLLGVLSGLALAFGLLVAGSFLTQAVGGDSEGYLILIGLILAIHGVLGVGWAAIGLVDASTHASRTRAAR